MRSPLYIRTILLEQLQIWASGSYNHGLPSSSWHAYIGTTSYSTWSLYLPMEKGMVTILVTCSGPHSLSHCILYGDGWRCCFNPNLSTNYWLAILLKLPLSTMILHNLSLIVPRVWKRLCRCPFFSFTAVTLSTCREMKHLSSPSSSHPMCWYDHVPTQANFLEFDSTKWEHYQRTQRKQDLHISD